MSDPPADPTMMLRPDCDIVQTADDPEWCHRHQRTGGECLIRRPENEALTYVGIKNPGKTSGGMFLDRYGNCVGTKAGVTLVSVVKDSDHDDAFERRRMAAAKLARRLRAEADVIDQWLTDHPNGDAAWQPKGTT